MKLLQVSNDTTINPNHVAIVTKEGEAARIEMDNGGVVWAMDREARVLVFQIEENSDSVDLRMLTPNRWVNPDSIVAYRSMTTDSGVQLIFGHETIITLTDMSLEAVFSMLYPPNVQGGHVQE